MTRIHFLYLVCLSFALQIVASSSQGQEGVWGNTELVEELRIGVLDGRDEYIFGRISHVAVNDSGFICVADAQMNTIRGYNSDGAFQRTIGREGEGPGEYRRISGMKVLPDGKLVVLDAPNHMIIFNPDGTFQSDFRVLNSLSASRMLEYDIDGYIYVKTTAEQPRGPDDWSFMWLKISLSGDLIGQIPIPREEGEGRTFTLITPEGALQNFTVLTLCAWSPLGYRVIGRNDNYSFNIERPEGTIHVNRNTPRIPLQREEKAEWKAWADYFGRSGSGPYPIPELKPAFKDLFIGDDGTIWVHRYVEAQKRKISPRELRDERPLLTWRERQTFDAYKPDGTFLGTIVLPPDTSVRVWREHNLWGVDSGGQIEQLVRWQIKAVSD